MMEDISDKIVRRIRPMTACKLDFFIRMGRAKEMINNLIICSMILLVA